MRKQLEKIVREAGTLMLEMQSRQICIGKKEGIGNYVTDADIRVQQYLQEKLGHVLPEADFIGEESGEAVKSGKLRWIVDPIDGTANFVRRIPFGAVSVGLVEGETAILGAVMNPYTGELYSAQQGKGAFCGGERIFAADRPLREALVFAGLTSYTRELEDRMFQTFRALFENSEGMRSLGAAVPELCMIAAGKTDVFAELRLQPWDYAAASCIITEAGGRISTMEGQPLSYEQECSVLAANPVCYEEALEICIKCISR